MKQFKIIRPAKSSWKFPELKDIERPLNSRGKKDAPLMGALLKSVVPSIDMFYSSPGKRAHETAKAFVRAYDKQISDISIESDLYFGDESDIMDVIHNNVEDTNVIAMFSHNPTSTYFVNSFGEEVLDNLPTCGVAIFSSKAKTWDQVDYGNSKLIKLLRPKFDL